MFPTYRINLAGKACVLQVLTRYNAEYAIPMRCDALFEMPKEYDAFTEAQLPSLPKS